MSVARTRAASSRVCAWATSDFGAAPPFCLGIENGDAEACTSDAHQKVGGAGNVAETIRGFDKSQVALLFAVGGGDFAEILRLGYHDHQTTAQALREFAVAIGAR